MKRFVTVLRVVEDKDHTATKPHRVWEILRCDRDPEVEGASIEPEDGTFAKDFDFPMPAASVPVGSEYRTEFTIKE